MHSIPIEITKKIATAPADAVIVCDNSDYVIDFTFDAEWSNYSVKTARFVYRQGNKSRCQEVVFDGQQCAVPKLRDTSLVLVGVYAGDLCTTTPAKIDCERSILCGDPVHEEPPEDVYNQLMQKLADIENGDVSGKMDKFGEVYRSGDLVEVLAGDNALSFSSNAGVTIIAKQVGMFGDSAEIAVGPSDESVVYADERGVQIYSSGGAGVQIHNVVDPETGTDAANKKYVDKKVATLELVSIVTELPTEGVENKTYFVAKTDGSGMDLYDEYMWINGAWEYIGTKQIEIDLTEYVKNTDYASVGKCGIVKTAATYDDGIYINTAGAMSLCTASTANIDDRKTKRPITPTNLDYAVKVGLTTNTETLTEEEKSAAQLWLGMNVQANEAKPWSVVKRSTDGAIVTGTPTANNHATTKAYVDGLAVARNKGIVAFTDDGAQEALAWAYNLQGNSIARRLGNGTLWVATPDVDNAAANKGYVDGLIAELQAQIDALKG